MTLRKHDGKLSAGRITLVCTILGTMAGIVIAIQPTIDFVKFGVSPWVSLPVKLESMAQDIKEIKHLQEQQIAKQHNQIADK